MTAKITPTKYYVGKFKAGVTHRVLRTRFYKSRVFGITCVVEQETRAGFVKVKEKFARLSGTFGNRREARAEKRRWDGK